MKFSIIIATSGKIETNVLLNSLSYQEYDDFEVIVVCDSCEKTFVDSIKKHNVYIIETDYKNLALSLNKGLGYASGEYVLFADELGMYLDNSFLKQLGEITKNENFDVLASGLNVNFCIYIEPIDENGHFDTSVFSKLFKHEFIKNIKFDEFALDCMEKFCCDVFTKENVIVNTWDYSYYNQTFKESEA